MNPSFAFVEHVSAAAVFVTKKYMIILSNKKIISFLKLTSRRLRAIKNLKTQLTGLKRSLS